MTCYMPPWHRRLRDGLRSLCHALFPPWQPLPVDAVVLVLDVIEPYRSLWTSRHNRKLLALLAEARAANCPVVFTKCASPPMSRL
jgi:hypothetical protein